MYINARPFLHVYKNDTRSYQLEVLKLLKDVDKVAAAEGITYTLEAGSALGAVRHGGFIPWDNDSDILMPLKDVKAFLVGLARQGLFETYDIWYYHSAWGWMMKDVFISDILKDPDNYCETSLDWAISQITYAIFRLVRKECLPLKLSLSKGQDTWQVAHFDTSLSTASLVYNKMLPEEKRTWLRRYYRPDDTYLVHPFIDIFPSVEMTPTEYIRMKQGFRIRDIAAAIGNAIGTPKATSTRIFRKILPRNHKDVASNMLSLDTFDDYRVGVDVDYSNGIRRAKAAAAKNDTLILSKAPWNLRKIIPYFKSDIYPPARIDYEDTQLNVPAKVIEVLENHYKDFRTPPPENERIQHAYHVDPTQFEQIVDINV